VWLLSFEKAGVSFSNKTLICKITFNNYEPASSPPERAGGEASHET